MKYEKNDTLNDVDFDDLFDEKQDSDPSLTEPTTRVIVGDTGMLFNFYLMISFFLLTIYL